MALDTRVLNEASADEFVKRNKNVRWDGWDIVTHVPNDRVWKHKNGRFSRETGKWGLEYRVSPDENGNWTVKVPVARRK
jgi:hypothetical protein